MLRANVAYIKSFRCFVRATVSATLYCHNDCIDDCVLAYFVYSTANFKTSNAANNYVTPVKNNMQETFISLTQSSSLDAICIFVICVYEEMLTLSVKMIFHQLPTTLAVYCNYTMK